MEIESAVGKGSTWNGGSNLGERWFAVKWPALFPCLRRPFRFVGSRIIHFVESE